MEWRKRSEVELSRRGKQREAESDGVADGSEVRQRGRGVFFAGSPTKLPLRRQRPLHRKLVHDTLSDAEASNTKSGLFSTSQRDQHLRQASTIQRIRQILHAARVSDTGGKHALLQFPIAARYRGLHPLSASP